jgi:acetyl-CoA acetyltransferase
MSLRGKAAIVGTGETAVDRLGRRPGEPQTTSAQYLARAARLAFDDAGLTKKDFDGQGLAAIYSTTYPQPFWPEEAAEILGISPGLLLGGGNGGASAVSLLGQAAAAVSSGLVDLLLCVAAAAPFVESFPSAHAGDSREFELPYGMMGPNSKVGLVMRRHMHEYGTTLEQVGKIAVTARYHATLNPHAYLRKPLTLEEYKSSRL